MTDHPTEAPTPPPFTITAGTDGRTFIAGYEGQGIDALFASGRDAIRLGRADEQRLVDDLRAAGFTYHPAPGRMPQVFTRGDRVVRITIDPHNGRTAVFFVRSAGGAAA